MTLTFRKRERMVSQRLIDDLFAGGSSHSVAAFPLRAVYKLRERNDHEVPLQMLISVPKKHFHHAVDRNRVKRQVREAWRRHKSLLVESARFVRLGDVINHCLSRLLLPTSSYLLPSSGYPIVCYLLRMSKNV